MILSQKEVMKVLKEDAKTLKIREIAKKYGITHHANIHNWLQGKNINVQMLEHFTKKITVKSEKRKVKGKNKNESVKKCH